MLFWTIILITIYLILLVRGSFFTNTIIKLGELTLKANEQGLEYYGEGRLKNELGKIGMPMLFYGLGMLIVQLFYLINALSVDYLKYPTIIIMIIIMSGFAIGAKKTKNKDDLTTEKGRQNYRTKLYKQSSRKFKSTMTQIIYLSYFIYMFYVLALR